MRRYCLLRSACCVCFVQVLVVCWVMPEWSILCACVCFHWSVFDATVVWLICLCALRFSVLCSGVCRAGRYGRGVGLSEDDSPCLACPAGRWSSRTGVTSCPGLCAAGYFCPAGSSSATTAQCPAGRYSIPGSVACADCGVGFTSGAGAAACVPVTPSPSSSPSIAASASVDVPSPCGPVDSDGDQVGDTCDNCMCVCYLALPKLQYVGMTSFCMRPLSARMLGPVLLSIRINPTGTVMAWAILVTTAPT